MIVMRPWVTAWLGESVIQDDAAASGDVRRDCVEYSSTLAVLVVSAIHELAQESAALRPPPAISFFHACSIQPQRIRRPIGVGFVVKEE